MSATAVEPKKNKMRLSQLDQLKKFSKVVADTGDFESMRKYQPQDATTNPSLIYAATQQQQYAHLLDEVIVDRKRSGLSGAAQIEDIIEHLLVKFGCEMLKIVPGRVSTETDARYSFDVEGSIKKARQLVKIYDDRGIPRERVLIKIASTWEGINAAEQLQKEGIRCNLTLLFSLPQAVRCAEAKVQLISPFVGRIYDWYKKENKRDYISAEDPGVQSVNEIYTYYKKFGYKTEVMGASFRNVGQILELAGCDLLTISPELMKELSESYEPVKRKLGPETAKDVEVKRLEINEKKFRYLVNDNAMATEKTAEGIRKFAAGYQQTREGRRTQDQLNKGTTRLNVGVDCKIAATHQLSAMAKQTRKHDFGGRPLVGKPKRDTSRLEDASAKQRKQHAHKAPIRRAASKFREQSLPNGFATLALASRS